MRQHSKLSSALLPPGALQTERRSGQASRPPESGGQRGPIGSREGRFLSKRCKHAAQEPPLALPRGLDPSRVALGYPLQGNNQTGRIFNNLRLIEGTLESQGPAA